MAIYVLDTNTLEFLSDTQSTHHTPCMQRLESLTEDDDICVSILVMYEIEYSIEGASADLKPRLQMLKDTIQSAFTILPLTETGSVQYGRLKHAFKTVTGSKPKAMRAYTVDMMIASTAMEIGAVLVSSDSVYQRLSDILGHLHVENWASGA